VVCRLAVGDEVSRLRLGQQGPGGLLLVGIARHEPAGGAEAHVDEA